MMTFTHKNETVEWSQSPNEQVSITTDAEELPKVLEAFERFLRGAGYYFDGHIEIVEDEEVHP